MQDFSRDFTAIFSTESNGVEHKWICVMIVVLFFFFFQDKDSSKTFNFKLLGFYLDLFCYIQITFHCWKNETAKTDLVTVFILLA